MSYPSTPKIFFNTSKISSSTSLSPVAISSSVILPSLDMEIACRSFIADLKSPFAFSINVCSALSSTSMPSARHILLSTFRIIVLSSIRLNSITLELRCNACPILRLSLAMRIIGCCVRFTISVIALLPPRSSLPCRLSASSRMINLSLDLDVSVLPNVLLVEACPTIFFIIPALLLSDALSSMTSQPRSEARACAVDVLPQPGGP